MSVHRAGGSGLKDEALHPPIRGASCTGRARARRLDGLSSFRTSPAAKGQESHPNGNRCLFHAFTTVSLTTCDMPSTLATASWASCLR